MYLVGTINIALRLMLSKAQNKYIRSLSQQKYRKEHNVYVAEGDKIAREWLQSRERIQMIVAVGDWVQEYDWLIKQHKEASLHVVSDDELATISTMQTANKVLLVVQRSENQMITDDSGWQLALDDIQDPGNMGTIIRIADWFGISKVVCSANCVDAYSPKVVQSAMGGHLRVNVVTERLLSYLDNCGMPIYAAALDGESVYEVQASNTGVLVIGNESKGISPEIMNIAKQKITIPRKGGAESLNAAISAGIICALLLPR
jgi:RNA methyltransferase, TrmH family